METSHTQPLEKGQIPATKQAPKDSEEVADKDCLLFSLPWIVQEQILRYSVQSEKAIWVSGQRSERPLPYVDPRPQFTDAVELSKTGALVTSLTKDMSRSTREILETYYPQERVTRILEGRTLLNLVSTCRKYWRCSYFYYTENTFRLLGPIGSKSTIGDYSTNLICVTNYSQRTYGDMYHERPGSFPQPWVNFPNLRHVTIEMGYAVTVPEVGNELRALVASDQILTLQSFRFVECASMRSKSANVYWKGYSESERRDEVVDRKALPIDAKDVPASTMSSTFRAPAFAEALREVFIAAWETRNERLRKLIYPYEPNENVSRVQLVDAMRVFILAVAMIIDDNAKRKYPYIRDCLPTLGKVYWNIYKDWQMY